MGSSFVLAHAALSMNPAGATARRRVLVTGAAGRIGSYFAEQGRDKYHLRLTDVDFGDKKVTMSAWGELMTGKLDDLDFLKRACEGIDTVVHLAGNPSPAAAWPELLQTNIIGTYHVCAAAKAAGCRRVVYASSIHAVSGYPKDVQVKTSEPVNPGDIYGVSKCFGEALGRYLSEQEGVSFIALRIGAFHPKNAGYDPEKLSILDFFVSDRDLNQLIQRSIDADDRLRFAVFHGLSNNRFKRLDISDAHDLLGYEPEDDFIEMNPKTRVLNLDEVIITSSQSGDGTPSGMRKDV